MHQVIDISRSWKVFPLELDHGLLGNTGRAYQRGYEPADAVEADLPMTAPAAWLDAGRIPDPYVGMNNRDLLWMEQKEWWYLKDFDLPRLDGSYRIVFQGVNYRAEAWLNDVQLATWEGSFLSKSVDIDPGLLRASGNRLAVRVRAQERAWEDGSQVAPCGFQLTSGHMRTQRPTPQFAHGWNWSPHLIAVGIWRPVILEWMDTARFADTRISADVSEGLDTGFVRFVGTIEILGSSGAALEVLMTVKAPDGTSVCARQEVEGRAIDLSVEVPNPDLWYPNGYGAQPLYSVSVQLLVADGEVCDERSRRVGFRRVEFVPNTNDMEVQAVSGQTNRMWSIVGRPYPWTMMVNGVRVFSKGTNWCPVDNLYRNRDTHIRRLLELACEAYYVFVRVWGGGLTESDYFYDCCDELGLLCLQEFWFACGSAPAMDYRVFFENVESELKRLRERTSIVLWGGGNEFNPDNHENRRVIDGIAERVDRIDGTREFRRGSPYRGDRHGGLVSTPHYTTNKYRDLLPGRKRLVLLRSECAVGRSPARPANISKFVPENARWPINWEVYQNHHAQREEWEMVSRPFGQAQEWEQTLLHASVFHCIDSRLNMEFARASKYESSGCWTWQLNASWPSFHREHIDWFGDPKPVYYWYKNACRPVIAVADFERFVWHPGERLDPALYIVNDSHADVAAETRIRIFEYRGALLHEDIRRTVVPADTSVDLGALEWSLPEDSAEAVFYLSMDTTVGEEIVHRNTYYIAASPDTRYATGVALGERLHLDHAGKHSEVAAPHYYTHTEIVDEATERDQEQESIAVEKLDAVYSTQFDLPATLAGEELEVFLPGVSGDDRVVLNGHVIGEGEIDPDREWNYIADPLRWPNLPTRYYPIDATWLKPKGNLLEIYLSGKRIAGDSEQRLGLTRMFYLRKRTPAGLQERIEDYNRRMEFFRPVVDGTPARLRVKVRATGRPGQWDVRVENTSSVSAVFLVLDLDDNGETRFHFDEGAPAAVHPGESISTILTIDGPSTAEPAVIVRALNAPLASSGRPVE